MPLLHILCWALIFITRLRFPPGQSLANVLKRSCNNEALMSQAQVKPEDFIKLQDLWCYSTVPVIEDLIIIVKKLFVCALNKSTPCYSSLATLVSLMDIHYKSMVDCKNDAYLVHHSSG